MHRSGEMREVTLNLTVPEAWGEGLVAVPTGEKLDLDVRLESVHEGILVSGEAVTGYTGICGRCLEPIDEPLEVDFQELFAYAGNEAADFDVQDDHVDLEILVRDAIVLSLPFQPVCELDCAGLDPETGLKLPHGTDAHPEEALDPRWAALGKFTTDPGTGEEGAG